LALRDGVAGVSETLFKLRARRVRCEKSPVYSVIGIVTRRSQVMLRTQNLRFAHMLCGAQIMCSVALALRVFEATAARQTEERLFSRWKSRFRKFPH
jgi:hypothetical protein